MLLAAAAAPAALAQQSAPIDFSQPLISADAIFGFENLSAWRISTNSAANTSVALSGIRTQGTSAYSVKSPANMTVLRSLQVSSSSSALAGIGVPGAKFAVDIRFPADKNRGSLRLVVNSLSRGLRTVSLGAVSFGSLRPGTFQTISFPITDQVRKSLAGAKYNDLSFELDLSTPQGWDEYLFDNLRIRSTQAVQADEKTQPPAGYGGSVDFDVYGGVDPQEKTFDVGPVQVPNGFHLKAGTAGGSTVQLDLGYSSTTVVATCLYFPDPGDSTQRSFVFTSCSGGPQPGDIVGASWGRLGITNGNASQHIKAQLARRPVGDQIGSGIIPPMPTFWGDEDTCIPAPVIGQVATVSQSCSDTVSQASKIVTDYFNAVTQSAPSLGWIVAPVPEFAKRHGDGTPPSSVATRIAHANTAANVLSIQKEGHANPGGSFDAYWKLTGGLNYTFFDGTNRALSHLDADFSTHGVFLGEDVTVLDISAFADSDSGQTVPTFMSANSHAEAHFYLFGLEYPVGGYQSDPSGAFNTYVPVFDETFDAPPVRFWIFAIKVGVSASAGLNLSGSVSPTGMNLTATPQGTIGAHLWGGIDAWVASGGVDVRVDLLSVKIPVAAQATWILDNSLISCSATITGSLDSDIIISSGGGHVDLVATFGVCPLCDDESQTLFSWPPLFSKTDPVFHESLDLASFPLPTSLCASNPLTVAIGTPLDPSSGGVPIQLTGTASSNNATGLPTPVACKDSTWVWSVDATGDVISGDPCNAVIVFGNTAHQATITLKVTHTVTLSDGRTLTEAGTATKTVNVTPLSTGLHIYMVYNVTTGHYETLGSTEPRLTSTTGPAPDGYILTATPVGIDTSNAKIMWTLKDTIGNITDITCYPQLDSPSCIGVSQDNPDGDPFSIGWSPDGSLGVWTITVQAIDKTSNLEIASGILKANFYLGPQ